MFNNLNFRLSTSMAHNVSSRGSEKFKQVLGASRGRPIFTATNIRQDPVSKKVLRIVDWNAPTHYLEQTDSTKQCAMPLPHVDFAGRLCLTFSGAEWYQSNQIIKWISCHSGTGHTYCWVGTRTSTPFHVLCASTTFSTLNERGFGLAGTAGAGIGQTQVYVGNGATNQYNTTSGGQWTINVPSYRTVSYQESASPEWVVFNKSAVAASGNTSNTPSSANPIGAAVLGASTAGALQFTGRWVEWTNFPILNTNGRTLIETCIHHTYGISII